MRIAFLIWDYSPSRGGQEGYFSRLAGALAEKGHEIHVLATACEKEPPGVCFHRVKIPAWGDCRRALSFVREARKMLAGEEFDIISGLTRFYPLDVYRMGSGVHKVWLQKKARNPLTRLFSYIRPFNWVVLFLERGIFNPANCRHVIANSNLCRGHLLSLYRYPPERVTVVYNGVDHDYFHPGLRGEYRAAVLANLGISMDSTVAVFVSNNLGRKGLETAIRALSVAGPDAPFLLVVGRGRPARYISLASRLGVAGRLRFTGPVGDVRPYYGAADYLVLPTRYDPFANVCLEAMACGLPVVTTRDNGAAELIDDGVGGFVLDDPDDASSLAGAMLSLADSRSREKMGAAALDKSLEFTIERNAGETLDVYGRVVSERSFKDR